MVVQRDNANNIKEIFQVRQQNSSLMFNRDGKIQTSGSNSPVGNEAVKFHEYISYELCAEHLESIKLHVF